jgi:hypothetical protein
MNKNIIFKGTTCILLGATIFGASALIPQEKTTAAVSSYKVKLCAHTQIETDFASDGVSTPYQILILSKNGKNAHEHSITGSSQNKSTEILRGRAVTRTQKGNKVQNVIYNHTSILAGSKVRSTSSTSIAETGKKTSVKGACSYSFYGCGYCKIKKTQTKPYSNFTIKCPYCTKQATINGTNFKIIKK